MPSTRGHHISRIRKFTLLIVPQGDAGARWSLPVRLSWIVGGILLFCALLVTAVILLIGFTPVGTLVPISDTVLQQKYGRELVDLQTRLEKFTEEMVVMREYNAKLRSALGETVPRDSVSPAVAARLRREAEAVPTAPTDERDESPSPYANQVSTAQQGAGTGGGPAPATFRAAFPISAPVVGYISRGFDGVRRHYGIDYAGRRGTVVSAAADGYVIFSGWTFDDGNMLILSHGGGFFTIYKHNQALLKSANEFVRRGEPIALLGNSGNTSHGPHLHFELWKDGQPQNPEEYVLATQTLSIN